MLIVTGFYLSLATCWIFNKAVSEFRWTSLNKHFKYSYSTDTYCLPVTCLGMGMDRKWATKLGSCPLGAYSFIMGRYTPKSGKWKCSWWTANWSNWRLQQDPSGKGDQKTSWKRWYLGRTMSNKSDLSRWRRGKGKPDWEQNLPLLKRLVEGGGWNGYQHLACKPTEVCIMCRD